MDDKFLHYHLHERCENISVMERSIAFFDFDGTITRKDTMLELVKFIKGKPEFYKGMALISPWLIAMKLKLVSNHKAKEILLKKFFKDMPLQEFNNYCERFSLNKIPALVRADAWKAIEEHKNSGDEIVVVTASAENWISPWCKVNGLKYIATKLETSEGNITGNLCGLNCNSAEKVNRIKKEFDPAGFKNIYCYGDSGGDKEMLSIASHPFFRLFKG